MQTETETRPAWWDDTAPIPMAPGPALDDTQIVVRGQSAPVRGRSEYAELAELAVAHGPRDTTAMLREARRVGELLGTRAYYDFPAGGGRVTGPTIDLMDALAIVWGRLVARVEILDETRDRVHLRGRVVDLLALTAVERDYMSAIAPAPGGFAKKPDQADRWRVMQLQSASSKAIRGALEHALPTWLTDAALDAARQAAAREATGGRPLPEARQAAAAVFGRHQIDRATLEVWVGAAYDLWTADELGRLRTLAKQLASGEVAPEAIRAQVAQAAALAPTQDASAGRLAGLGLGNPGPAPAAPAVQQSTPPSPQPAPPKAQPTTEPAAHQTGEAPASGGPLDAERAALVAELRDLEARLAPAVRDQLRADHELRRILPRTVDLAKLRGLVADVRATLARPAPAAVDDDPVPATEDWDGPTGQELVDECGELLRSVEPEQRTRCLAEAGIPQIDGAPEPALRRLLVALMDVIPVEG